MAVAVVATVLSGCAGARAERAIRTEGPRMVELFRGASPAAEDRPVTDRQARRGCSLWRRLLRGCEGASGGRKEEESGLPGEGSGPADYTRTAQNELQLLFPRLPNPDIVIYVFPHLATDERVPVPGYTTAVPLYERVEYALPGETEVME